MKIHLVLYLYLDEMLGILADRDRIRRKKELEHAQGMINGIYMHGLDADE